MVAGLGASRRSSSRPGAPPPSWPRRVLSEDPGELVVAFRRNRFGGGGGSQLPLYVCPLLFGDHNLLQDEADVQKLVVRASGL